MEVPATERFRAKLKAFLEANQKRLLCPPADRAQFFVDKEPALSRSYLIAQTETLIAAEERKARKAEANPEDQPQLRFLGDDFAVLFNSPRHLLPLKGGMRRQLQSMTVTQLRESAVAIRARISPKASRQASYLESLADQMSPYSQTHRKLTLGDWLELRAAGIEVESRA